MLRCPKCGSTALNKGCVDKRGCKTYKCKKCLTVTRHASDYVNGKHGVKCIHCGGSTTKQSFTKYSRQKYKCKVCGKTFINGKLIKRQKLPPEAVKKVEMFCQVQGLKLDDIAKMANVSRTSVKRIKKNLIERIKKTWADT